MKHLIALGIGIALFGSAVPAYAQTIEDSDVITFPKAEVIRVVHQDVRQVPGVDTTTEFQTIEAKILSGTEAGKLVLIENDFLMLKKGDVFYVRHVVNDVEGINTYAVLAPYRLPSLLVLVVLFLASLFVFGGRQGLRGLFALLGSLCFIGGLLIPGILHGLSPLWVSFGVAALIVTLGSYITHGFTKTTTAAVFGMLATISITSVLAHWAIHAARLTGFATEEATYLNIQTHGAIDFLGLLMGSMLIGLLGVLYDAAISQAIAVEELSSVGKELSKWELYKRAQRIGREHVGALVNTLAIAYVGASLPLILFVVSLSADTLMTINQELFATELVRMMVGTIGIILAVPITTAIAVYILSKWPPQRREGHHYVNHQH